MLLMDLGRFMAAKSLLTRACNRGATIGSAALPRLAADSGPMIDGAVYCDSATDPAAEVAAYYQAWRTEQCARVQAGQGSTADCPSSFSNDELMATASAVQYICDAENEQVLIPKRLGVVDELPVSTSRTCGVNERCVTVLPISFPLTDQSGVLGLECRTQVRLVSLGLLSFISPGTTNGGLPVRVVSIRNIGR